MDTADLKKWFEQQLESMNDKSKAMREEGEMAFKLYKDMYSQLPKGFQDLLAPTSAIKNLERTLMCNHEQEIKVVEMFIKHVKAGDGAAYKRQRLLHEMKTAQLRKTARGRSRQQADAAAVLNDSARRLPNPPVWVQEEQQSPKPEVSEEERKEKLKEAIHSKFDPVFGSSRVNVDIVDVTTIANMLKKAEEQIEKPVVKAEVSKDMSAAEFHTMAVKEMRGKRSVDDIIDTAVRLKNQWKKAKQQ